MRLPSRPLCRAVMALVVALTAAAVFAAGPLALADEKHSVMGVAVRWAESARPKIGDALAVRLTTRWGKTQASCQAGADKWNAKQKVRWSTLGNPFKYQVICYRASLTDTHDITMDICGKPGLLYRRTCTFLVYKRPDLEQYKPGQWIRFQ